MVADVSEDIVGGPKYKFGTSNPDHSLQFLKVGSRLLTEHNGDDADAGDSHSCKEPHDGKHNVGSREGTGDSE